MNQSSFLAERKQNIVVQELEGELLIYDLDENKAFCLNETGAEVWQLCDGKNSASEISRELSVKLKTAVTEDLVWLAIDQFKQDNLLINNEKLEIEFGGLSRREVIRKVGLASVIALPLIASLVAPKASMAGSVCGSTCSNNTQCTSSLCPTCVTNGPPSGRGCRA